MWLLLGLLACTSGELKTSTTNTPDAGTANPVPAPQPKAVPCSKRNYDAMLSGPPKGCDSETLTKTCVEGLMTRIQKIEGMACPVLETEPDFGTKHPTVDPDVYLYPPPVHTPAGLAQAMRLVVSEKLVKGYFKTLRQYGDHLAVMYPGCGGPGEEIIEHNGKFYRVMMTDYWEDLSPEERLKNLGDALAFTKNKAGTWVADSDMSYGCWEPPIDHSDTPSTVFKPAIAPPL